MDAQRQPLGVIGRAPGGDARAVAWEFPADLRAPSRARNLTRGELAAWKLTDSADIDDVVLIVDELVANAVVHGRGPIRLRLLLDGLMLRGEISDHSPVAAPTNTRTSREEDAEDGRGLLLVAALAAACGSTPTGPGKTVWFQFLLTGLAP
ncbi:ATP-binding protein [Actinocorallia longicatena]|uniref:ATP-binding protein n=1 Tax=Actinocorallia longicatena TaxID=111803 RepID=A0ABP6PX84_9ACTN